MHIKILGSGCKRCVALTQNIESASRAAGIEAEIEKVTDVIDIARYGIMSTPGLIINDKVISTGKVLSAEQIAEHLANFKQ